MSHYVEGYDFENSKWVFDGPMSRSAADRKARKMRKDGLRQVVSSRGAGPNRIQRDIILEKNRPEYDRMMSEHINSLMEDC